MPPMDNKGAARMKRRTIIRWTLFFIAVICFIYFVFIDNGSIPALVLFIISGGLWYWREMRKMRELDALRIKHK